MLIRELKRFVQAVAYWLLFIVALSGFFFAPLFEDGSISARVFRILESDLLPDSVQFMVTDPFGAFLALAITSIASAFIVSFPLLLFGIVRYISPALTPREQKRLMLIMVPTTFLFVGGCIFAYHLIIPLTFELLYGFAGQFNVAQFFLLNSFIYTVFSLMVLTGIVFLLPVFMVLLSTLGIVPPSFWRNHWRHALLFFLVFSAVITPDGTGVTMLLFTAPLIGLYAAGCILTK